MRIVVTGSRHWKPANVRQIHDKLNELVEQCVAHGEILEIAHGASKGGGVDQFVADWLWFDAPPSYVDEWPFPVRRDLDGNHRGAPLNRNKRMVNGFLPDLVIGFRSAGKSNGTDQTLRFAESLGIPTEIIHESVDP